MKNRNYYTTVNGLDFLVKEEGITTRIYVFLQDEEFNYDFLYFVDYIDEIFENVSEYIMKNFKEYEKMANYEFDDITADYGLLLNLVSKYAV